MDSTKDPLDVNKSDFHGNGTSSHFTVLQHIRKDWIKLEQDPNVFACQDNLPDSFKCENCYFETNLKVSLKDHFILNHQKNLENQTHPDQFRNNVLRQCGHCDFQTYSALVLLKHHVRCDGGEDLGNEAYKINWLECGLCPYKTQNKYHIQTHIKLLHTAIITGSLQEQIPNIHHIQTHIKLLQSRNLTDSLQKKQIPKIHTDSAPFVWYYCNKCEYKSKERGSLKRHITRIHTVWHHCDRCKYNKTSVNKLKQHIKNVHTDPIQWHRCDKCRFKTKKENSLKKHITKIHPDAFADDIDWYHCSICKYKTIRRKILKQHMKKVHTYSPNNVRYHYCDVCEFVTKTKRSLRRHGKIHNVRLFHCANCRFKCLSMAQIKKHSIQFHKETAYTLWFHCKKCEYKTDLHSSMQKHIIKCSQSLSHSGSVVDSACA